jgi:hypothetical protein
MLLPCGGWVGISDISVRGCLLACRAGLANFSLWSGVTRQNVSDTTDAAAGDAAARAFRTAASLRPDSVKGGATEAVQGTAAAAAARQDYSWESIVRRVASAAKPAAAAPEDAAQAVQDQGAQQAPGVRAAGGAGAGQSQSLVRRAPQRPEMPKPVSGSGADGEGALPSADRARPSPPPPPPESSR